MPWSTQRRDSKGRLVTLDHIEKNWGYVYYLAPGRRLPRKFCRAEDFTACVQFLRDINKQVVWDDAFTGTDPTGGRYWFTHEKWVRGSAIPFPPK